MAAYKSLLTVADAGDGNDEVRSSGYSTVNAGNGSDLVVTLGYSQVDGGAGNDTLIAFDGSVALTWREPQNGLRWGYDYTAIDEAISRQVVVAAVRSWRWSEALTWLRRR